MKTPTIKITCDHCGKDITDSPDKLDFTDITSIELVGRKGKLVFNLSRNNFIEGDFCNQFCLGEFIKTSKFTIGT